MKKQAGNEKPKKLLLRVFKKNPDIIDKKYFSIQYFFWREKKICRDISISHKKMSSNVSENR